METIINSKLNDNINPLNIVGDKGYIKNHSPQPFGRQGFAGSGDKAPPVRAYMSR